MAIIYSYPDKANPSLLDKLIINDVESSPIANETKRITIQALADSISGQFTLQEVLQAGDTAVGNTGNTWEGDMSLTQGGSFIAPQVARRWIVDLNGATGSSNNKTAYLVGDLEIASNGTTNTGDIDMSGDLTVGANGSIAGDLNMTGLTGDVILNGGVYTATAGKQTKFQASTGVGGGFSFDTNGNATAGFIAGTVPNKLNSVEFQVENGVQIQTANAVVGNINILAGADLTLRAGDVGTFSAGTNTLVVTDGSLNSTVNVGGTTGSNRAAGVFVQAENFYQTRTNTGSGKLYIIGGPQPATDSDFINSVTPHTFMDEIRLGGTAATFNETAGTKLTAGTKGDAGTAGQLLASGGPGAPASWVSSSSLSVENLIESVENNTGSPILKGTPIHIATNPSGTPRVEPADAGTPATMPASGLAYEDIPGGVGQAGQMIIAGQLEGIDTAAIPVGGVAYVNAGGGFANRPSGVANAVQNIGIVTKSGGGVSGIMQVTATGRSNDLPNNNPNALFTSNASGNPTSTTGVLEVNAATGLTTITDSFKIDAVSPVGSNNTIIGNDAASLLYNTGGTANANVVLGKNTMSGGGAIGDNSAFNVAIGNQALAGNNNAVVTDPLRNTSSSNVAIGHQALSQPGGGAPTAPPGSRIGSGNVAIGYQATPSAYDGGGANEGENNVFIGNSAAFNLTTGYRNVGIGANVLNNLTTGARNVGIGGGGTSTGGALTTGSGNILIGDRANVALGTDGVAVAIGQQATTGNQGVALGLAATADAGVSLGANSGTGPSGAVGNSICIGSLSSSGQTNGIAIGVTAEVGPHQEGVAIGTGAKTAAAHDVALGGIDMIGPATGVGPGGTLGIGVRDTGVPPAPGAFASQNPIGQIPVKFPDAAGNLIVGHIYIYP